MNYTINKFEFITPQHYCDKSFHNWSRGYEWGYVLKILDTWKPRRSLTVHNMCAGPGKIHKQFHDCLTQRDIVLTNSDIVFTDVNKTFKNMVKYDFTEKWKNKEEFDIVLCISTLEEVSTINARFKGIYKDRRNNLINILENFLEQLKPNGRLIITLDYPDVDFKIFEDIFNMRILNINNRLISPHPMSSTGQENFLNIILIDITKT